MKSVAFIRPCLLFFTWPPLAALLIMSDDYHHYPFFTTTKVNNLDYLFRVGNTFVFMTRRIIYTLVLLAHFVHHGPFVQDDLFSWIFFWSFIYIIIYINPCPFSRAHYPNVICFRHPAVCLHYYQLFCSFVSFRYFLICLIHPVLTTSDVNVSAIRSSWYHIVTTLTKSNT